ncbi:hypothetical protein BC940DRAFT_278101 [Gongronella butleri]|nr:hypothetical protein BC940DRAFT_278101 [Gongronella butleri]
MMYKQLMVMGVGLMASMVAGQDTNQNSTSIPPSIAAPLTVINNATDFCLFLPPQPGLQVAINEDNGIPFCMINGTVPQSQPFPQGFITTAHYYQNTSSQYIQVTGYFDRTKYNLSPSDEGGQYDSHGNHKPNNATCEGYPYFVSLIEPADDRFCIRCCTNTADCKTGISQYGCRRVVSGNYEYTATFDDVPPSPENENLSSPNATNLNATQTGAPSGASGQPSTFQPSEQPNSGASQLPSSVPSNSPDNSGNAGAAPPADAPVMNDLDTLTANYASTDDPNSISTMSDEATYLNTQLANPQVDLSALQTQFTTFTQNMASQYPDQQNNLDRMKTIILGFTTADQWKQLASLLQQKAPSS